MIREKRDHSLGQSTIESTFFAAMEDESQVRVRFVTDIEEYQISDTPFALPVSLNRASLSNVVNHFLSRDEADHIDFDFEIGGRLLRSKLSTFIKKYRISTEEVLTLKYFPVVSVDTDNNQSVELPSWIGHIDIVDDSIGIAGCYDGNVQMFDPQNVGDTTSFRCHDSPIRTVAAWSDPSGDTSFFATGSKDCNIKLWALGPSRAVHNVTTIAKHSNSVESLCVWSNDNNKRLLSGDWNGTLMCWKLDMEAKTDLISEQPAKKKRKDSASLSTKMYHLSSDAAEPEFVLKAHAQSITRVLAPSGQVYGFTSSADHSIKVWDFQRQDALQTYNPGKSATSLSFSGAQSTQQLLASSHVDGRIRLWDARVQSGTGKSTSVMTFGRVQDDATWISDVRHSYIISALQYVVMTD